MNLTQVAEVLCTLPLFTTSFTICAELDGIPIELEGFLVNISSPAEYLVFYRLLLRKQSKILPSTNDILINTFLVYAKSLFLKIRAFILIPIW